MFLKSSSECRQYTFNTPFVTLNIFVFLERHNETQVWTLLLNTSLCHLKYYCFFFQSYLGSHQAKMNNTSTPASASAKIQFNPLMPVSLVVLYWCLSAAILILCVVSSVAMGRTKRTPYTAKLLSLGLLIYDILFLILSPVSKLFDFNDVYLIWHAIRGFQIAAQVVIASMSIERLAVFNWPYEYLRVMTERRTKTICIAVCTLGYLHYAVMRGVFCYASDTVDNCGL